LILLERPRRIATEDPAPSLLLNPNHSAVQIIQPSNGVYLTWAKLRFFGCMVHLKYEFAHDGDQRDFQQLAQEIYVETPTHY